MSRDKFSKTMLRVFGAISLILSSMCLYSGISHGIQIGIAGYVLGAVLLIVSAVFDMDRSTMMSKVQQLVRICAVVFTTILLHAAGIWAADHIHWIAGSALILFGLANLMFLAPAAKGFAEGK